MLFGIEDHLTGVEHPSYGICKLKPLLHPLQPPECMYVHTIKLKECTGRPY